MPSLQRGYSTNETRVIWIVLSCILCTASKHSTNTIQRNTTVSFSGIPVLVLTVAQWWWWEVKFCRRFEVLGFRKHHDYAFIHINTYVQILSDGLQYEDMNQSS